MLLRRKIFVFRFWLFFSSIFSGYL